MFGERVPKHHPRVRFYGQVDELFAYLTAARAQVAPDDARLLEAIQERLVRLMSELACPASRVEEALKRKRGIAEDDLAFLDSTVAGIEAQGVKFRDWLEPVEREYGLVEIARAVCRRAETQGWLVNEEEPVRPILLQFLNRLSDVLWLIARRPGHRGGE